MSSRFVFCDCCACVPDVTFLAPDPIGTGNGGGSYSFPILGHIGYDYIDATLTDCSVWVIQLRFATEAIGDAIVGTGNHHSETIAGDAAWVTDEWVLFGDGSTYARDSSRPVNCTVTADEIPAGIVVPLTVELPDTGYTWTRKSNDPMSADFNTFEKTAGDTINSAATIPYCVGIIMRVLTPAWVWEGDPVDIEIEITSTDTDEPCPSLEGPICLALQSDIDLITVDDWRFGGSWVGDIESYSITCPGPSTADGTKHGWFVADNAHIMRAGIWIVNAFCNTATQYIYSDCHDPKDDPDVANFDVDYSGCDGTDFAELTVGATCDASGDNCPPDDCPVQFCKWQWNTDTSVWDLIDSNCIDPATCPGPPDDPAVTDVAWITCNCCVTPGPCDAHGGEAGFTCTWIWTLAHTWNHTACAAGSCCAKPARDGLFVGETVDGICCTTGGGADCE